MMIKLSLDSSGLRVDERESKIGSKWPLPELEKRGKSRLASFARFGSGQPKLTPPTPNPDIGPASVPSDHPTGAVLVSFQGAAGECNRP